MKSKIFLSILFLFCGLLCFNSGCIEGTGILTINLTDDPADYEEVYVTFSEVSVHRGEEQDIEETTQGIREDGDDENDGNWIIINDKEQGFNLLEYQSKEKEFELLAQAVLVEGVYTQIRLKIVGGTDEDKNLKTYVTVGGVTYPLEVPSGAQSGLKLIHPFRVVEGTVTTLYLDFDAEKSVKQTGNGQYKLKPTIAVISNLSSDQGIKGTVQVADTEEVVPVTEATVYAYTKYEEDSKILQGSIGTDDEGAFELPLPAGTYTVVVTAGGYEDFITAPIEVVADTWVELDPIQLEPTTP